ncbi:MAG: hypothetical protein ACRD2C_08770 [Acidimicrobiales bacterium]
MGTAAEVERFVAELGRRFEVVDVSRLYPCRGDSALVRVYAEVRI